MPYVCVRVAGKLVVVLCVQQQELILQLFLIPSVEVVTFRSLVLSQEF